MKQGVRINLDRGAAAKLARQAEMGRYLEGVADDMAREVTRRLPYPRILGGVTVDGTSSLGSAGYEGRVDIHGSGWHLWEFGTVNHGARPAIRPGVQSVLSKVGGRWTAQ